MCRQAAMAGLRSTKEADDCASAVDENHAIDPRMTINVDHYQHCPLLAKPFDGSWVGRGRFLR